MVSEICYEEIRMNENTWWGNFIHQTVLFCNENSNIQIGTMPNFTGKQLIVLSLNFGFVNWYGSNKIYTNM